MTKIINAVPSLADMPQKKRIQLYTPHKGQLKIHASKARFRVVACGRRFGKTLMACNEISRFALTHDNANCAWIAPTYRQSKIAYRLIRRALRNVITYKSDSELRLEFETSSSITFYSSDNYDALRGNGFHFVVMDECADINEKAWLEVIRPTLSDTQGRALMIGTPKGRNFFFNLFARGQDTEYPDYASFHAPTSANPYIPAGEVEAARRELPEDTFQQEYLAVFLEESAGVFRGIDACIRGLLDPDYKPAPARFYTAGWDPAKYLDYSVFTVIDAGPRDVVAFERINQIDYTKQLDRMSGIAAEFHAHCYQDVTGVGAPLAESFKALGRQKGFQVEEYLFTNASKKVLIEQLQIDIQNQTIHFPAIPVLLNELRQYEYTLTPSRQITYNAPKGQHDDTVISLALANYGASQPYGPLAWSVDEDVSRRTLEMTEFPENKRYDIVEVEKWGAYEEGEIYDYE
jgi:hypothetical protein